MIVGSGFTVIVVVLVQPSVFVYVITVFPADIPDIVAVSLVPDTVANPDKSVVQGFTDAAVADPLSEMFVPTQTVLAPVMFGNELMVINFVLEHPFVFLKVIVVVPATSPLSVAVSEVPLIVADAGEELVHGALACAVTDPVNVMLDPTQRLSLPVMVGKGFTLIDFVLEHPFEFV